MSKPFYADYVNRMLRFYVRKVYRERMTVENPVDKKNCLCAAKVLDALPEKDRNVIMDIYEGGDTLADNIYHVSKEMNINQDVLWTLMSKVTKEIAKERGLV